ncbi:MAG: heavy-metal-associated domain-containing protein [Flavobacteriales bacterium]|jgi:Cu+-exporting ATPase|nr:heavy-metal-associated domain-containing protein [Flavobacteriales bacterium]
MKTRILSFAIVTASAFLIGCGQTGTEATNEEAVETTSVEEMKTPVTLAVKIEGMSCPGGCAAKIQEDCGNLAGVGSSVVNFDEAMGYFTFDASLLSEEDILQCISNTNGGGIYTGTVVSEDESEEVEGDEATTEEALHVIKHDDEASV